MEAKSIKEPIPETFNTLEEAAEFWDTHDTADIENISRLYSEFSALLEVGLKDADWEEIHKERRDEESRS